MQLGRLDSPFLKYLVETEAVPGDRLPALSEISEELGISNGKLREQFEVARSLGLVSARPRLGIQREPFDFSNTISGGLLFSLATGEATFEQYNQLRQVVEVGFWDQAVALLTTEDEFKLKKLVDQAWAKLRGEPIHIPNCEHRQLHLIIFSRLENPFVQGILAAYWDAYEASELTRFASYAYWVKVWTYHEHIVEALCNKDFEQSRRLLVEHFSLLRSLPATTEEVSADGSQTLVSNQGEIR
ncbi:MAG: FadR/GntR family transcriptional regulator [Candidatus Promineifilaceae bacterium]